MPTPKKITLIGICVLLFFGAILVDAANNPINDSLRKGKDYLVNSDTEYWNATDATALAYFFYMNNINFSDYPALGQLKQRIELEKYPFVSSIFNPDPIHPNNFEENLETPTWYYKIIKCQSFTAEEFTNWSTRNNNQGKPYDATHVALLSKLIQKRYSTPNCNKPGQVNGATQVIAIIKNKLNFVPDFNQANHYDAWVSQECARALILKTSNPATVDFVINAQDQNNLDLNVYGGWWSSYTNTNPPYYSDQNYWVYNEKPNIHTTLFSMCILHQAANQI